MKKHQLHITFGILFILLVGVTFYSCGKLDGAAVGEAVSIIGDVQ